MYEALFTGPWKKVILVIFITCSLLLMVSYYDYNKLLNYQVLITTKFNQENVSNDINVTEDEDNYLISSSKCKILNLDPFSRDAKKYFTAQKYKPCTKNGLLSYVTKQDNIATVHIDGEVIHQYSKKSISCCYSDVSRSTSPKNPDDSIKITNCKHFQDNVTITQEALIVKCTEKGSKKQLYENVHSSVTITKDVQKKLGKFDESTKPLSVLFIGIDSISRLNFIRALPNTYRYVEDNGWISLKGYNKMDDNTFPNIMAIQTGFNQTVAYNTCKPKSIGFLDTCPMVWYDYRKLGYVTAYAEDETSIGTFNYNKKGFVKPPADYYFRPYMMATEKLSKVMVSYMTYCTGPETAGERIFNLITDFGVTFLNEPHFGVFWMNSFSHNEVNTPSMMDNKLKSFLANLNSSGVTNNSIIIFLSDHGMRFGDIRLTETGWLEERLPFIYFSFPPWFKDKFPREYANLKGNINKLTTPYDLYMTLQHILVLSGLNYTMKPSDACPQCRSLFEEINSERSCEEAAIAQHWCTCAGFFEIKLNQEAETKLGGFFINEIHKIISAKGGDAKCTKYEVESIKTRLSHKFSYKNSSYVLVSLRTHPKAVFETTITYVGRIEEGNFEIGDISRLDYYSSHSHCISDAYLKKYCYCR